MRTATALAILLASLAAPAAARERAPEFLVRDLAGNAIHSKGLAGKPVILDFWATWCGPCRAELPHLSTLHRKYSEKGLVILGISVDQPGTRAVRAYVERYGVPFQVAMANREIVDSFGPIRGIPTTFFINRQGEIVKITVGYRDLAELERIVAQLW